MDILQSFFDFILTAVIGIFTAIVAFSMLFKFKKQNHDYPTPSRKNEDWLRNHWKQKATEYRGKIEHGQMICKK
ncbi:hypothetical protein [Brevibacillus reuszeri]|uniref:hypothetical protein n=1 Tax=Brevibacillus reuszeri TaxID=54915 RepID=UPI000CCBF137|nr:hypothetical protein [Brevibacillus reuszeri]